MLTAAEFVATPPEAYDLPTILDGLATAAAIELATLPPYLCGGWSIVDDPSGVASLISSVFFEEMLHLGLVCNMTTAIGGTPSLAAPSYPGPLPAGLRPGLTVDLQGLTPDYVGAFMQIEFPENGPVASDGTTPTIGAFYTTLAAMLTAVAPPFVGGTQQTTQIGSNTLPGIPSLDAALAAITVIKEQGEGTSTSPDAVDTSDPTELAHYYRFAEIANGHRLVQVDGAWQYAGDPVAFPTALPMAKVPPGGWTDTPTDVTAMLGTFSAAYASVLGGLNKAWAPAGTPDDLNDAITAMFGLKQPAVWLMQQAIPSGSGNYGPDFVLRP